MLEYLRLKGVGPAPRLELEFAPRLNVITGDNGLGKSFILDITCAERPRDLWSQFRPELAKGFRHLCGYSAMYSPVGSVDHYLSFKHHPELAYDWRNYRFAEEWLNKSKQVADRQVLDPYQVRDDWFEIIPPSLQLRVTDRVPARQRARAEYTLRRLHLRDDERIVRQRRKWYELYQAGDLTLDGLADVAPLVAVAVGMQLGRPSRSGGQRATPKRGRKQ